MTERDADELVVMVNLYPARTGLGAVPYAPHALPSLKGGADNRGLVWWATRADPAGAACYSAAVAFG